MRSTGTHSPGPGLSTYPAGAPGTTVHSSYSLPYSTLHIMNVCREGHLPRVTSYVNLRCLTPIPAIFFNASSDTFLFGSHRSSIHSIFTGLCIYCILYVYNKELTACDVPIFRLSSPCASYSWGTSGSSLVSPNPCTTSCLPNSL